MNKTHYEDQFLDYLENTLSAEQKEAFEQALQENPDLKESFDDYQELLQTEALLAEEEFIATPHFVELVLDDIGNREVSSFWRYIMELTRKKRWIYSGLGTLAVLLICVKIGTEVTDSTLERLQQSTPNYASQGEQLETQSPMVKPETSGAVVEKQQSFDDARRVPEGIVVDNDMKLADKEATTKSREEQPADSGIDELQSEPSARLNESEGSMLKKKYDKAALPMADPAAKEEAKRSAPSPITTRRDQIAARPQAGLATRAKTQNNKGIQQKYGRQQYAEQGASIAINDLIGTPASKPLGGQVGSSRAGSGQIAPAERKHLPMMELEADAQDDFYAPPQPLRRRWIPAQEQNRERYVEYSEQPRIMVRNEPRSTFSIDVDTGSYTNSRRILQQGMLPPATSVRIEEFINYFDYSYPSRGNLPFTLNYEIAPSPFNEGRHLISFGIKAKELTEERKPWNLVFLIDVSGSMNTPMKLDLVKRSLRVLVQNMQAQDSVALVTYAGSSRIALNPTTVSNKSTILHAIDSLRAGGSTNGASGIQLAYQTAQQHFKSDGVNRVILATDGDFNVGISSHDQLVKLVENKRKSGITLTTIGVGSGNINEGMMEQIANKGNGNYFYIDSFKEGRRVFADKLASTVEVVAKDVKLQVEFNPANVLEYRLVGYDNRKLRNQDFNNDKIDAGEIGAGHTVTALYEVVLANSEAAKNLHSDLRYGKQEEQAVVDPAVLPKELAFLKIRYKEPQGKKSKLISYPLLQRDVKNTFADASTDFRFASAVAGFGLLLRESQYIDDMTYDDIERIASQSTGSDTHGARREFIELVRNAQSLDPQ